MAWDPEHARAETFWTVEDLCRRTPDLARLRGRPIDLDLFFLPEDGTAERMVRAFAMFGLSATAEGRDVTVRLTGIPFDAEAIWAQEALTARIARANGYIPDGWGFEA